MKKITFWLPIFVLICSLGISGCDSSSDNPEQSTDTQDPPSSIFVSRSIIPAGETCPAGGVQIDMGFDNNSNNVLDPGEITNTEIICNGTDGEDAQLNITSDTTWLSGENYIIQRDIVIKEGVTLTIEPGATVSLNPGTIIYIDGTLDAQGTSTDHIIVKNEGTIGDGMFYLTSTSENNVMRYIEMKNSIVQIMGAEVEIDYCKFTGDSSADNGERQINIDGEEADVTMSNCTVSESDYTEAVAVDGMTATVTMTNCIINEHQYGVNACGVNYTVTLNGCSLTNFWGTNINLQMMGTVTINNSNIINTYPMVGTFYSYYNGTMQDQDATGNWWGTTDTATIDNKIYDIADGGVGAVNYSSYLSTAVSVTGCGY